jgi:hypothetical protein
LVLGHILLGDAANAWMLGVEQPATAAAQKASDTARPARSERLPHHRSRRSFMARFPTGVLPAVG